MKVKWCWEFKSNPVATSYSGFSFLPKVPAIPCKVSSKVFTCSKTVFVKGFTARKDANDFYKRASFSSVCFLSFSSSSLSLYYSFSAAVLYSSSACSLISLCLCNFSYFNSSFSCSIFNLSFLSIIISSIRPTISEIESMGYLCDKTVNTSSFPYLNTSLTRARTSSFKSCY